MGIWWKKVPILYGKYGYQFPRLSQFDRFRCIFSMGNWWGNPCISHMMKYTTGWESNGKKHPYYGKSMGTNFPGFAHLMVFAEFSHAVGNWLEKPHISHVMKSTIGWESNKKKAPILWEKYEYQFPRSSPYDRIDCIFSCYGKLMGKPMHFPYDEVYHRMGIEWEKSTHTMGKVWIPISQVLPIKWVLFHSPVL